MNFQGKIFKYSEFIDGHQAYLELHDNLDFLIPNIKSLNFGTGINVKNGEGVYLFIAKENFMINLLIFGLFAKNCSKIYKFWNNKIKWFNLIKIKKGQVFYIGSGKNYFLKRAREHLTTRNNNDLHCLRLARLNRKFVKKHLNLVVIETTGNVECDLETALRERYLPLFSNK